MRLPLTLLAFLAVSVGPARADPLSIGVAILVNLGYAGTISGTLATIVGGVVIGAGFLGASLLSSALTPRRDQPQVPDPSDRQVTVRSALAARKRYYGRVKVGGDLWFFESKAGVLYAGIVLNHGEVSLIRELWLNDQSVTLGGNSEVLQAPYARDDGSRVAYILIQKGGPGQAAHVQLTAAFPGIVTAAHRLRGLANALTMFVEVPAADIGEVYPQGNPALRTVMDASLVMLVRSGGRGWSENPADIIYDYLTGSDEAGVPVGAGYTADDADLPSFQAFATLCAVRALRRDGTSEPLYRYWGGYALNEQPRDVLPRMLRSCDGDLYLTTAGKIAIRGGWWTPPTLVLDSALGHIVSGEFRQGQQALAAFNELTLTYLEPALDYREVEGQTWVDAANVAERGEVLEASLSLPEVPSHSQARRLAKIKTHRDNPLWVGTIVTNAYGLNAIGEETATIRFGPLGIDTTFSIRSVRILDDLSGCQIEVASFGPDAYAWDPELEEGAAPGQPPDTTSPVDLPPPEGAAVEALERIINGSSAGVYLSVTWDALARPALLVDVQYRLSPSGAWSSMSVDQSARIAESGLIDYGETYEVRLRVITPGGVAGDWSEPSLSIVASV